MVACRQNKAVKTLCSVQFLQLKQHESKNQSVHRHPLRRQAILKIFLQNIYSKDKAV
jgi:hypothetical protein